MRSANHGAPQRAHVLRLDAARLAEHAARIRALSGKALALLAGVEVDILPDGSLDLPLRDLAGLQCVVASIHARFNDPPEKIKRAIDRSDYYIVLVAGRYGSLGENNLSYTEQEFDYAVERGIPVLAFVHGNPDSIPVGKTDKNDAAAKRLQTFRL